MAFDKIVANSGDGLGAGFAFDTFTDTDAVEKIMTYTGLAFGALDGGYTVVTTTDRFPVALSVLPDTAAGDLAAINAALAGTLTVGSHAVTNAGTFAVQAAQSGAWVVDLGANNDVTVTSGAINATLDAETTKVIGTVNVAAAQTIGVTGTFWQTTQPISGTITETNSADSLTSLQLIDDAAATIGTTDVLRVAVFDASNNQITSFGGGGGGDATAANQTTIIGHVDGIETLLGTIDADTSQIRTLLGGTLTVTQNVQYTEADVDTTITGTAIMWEDTSNVLRAVSASKPLPIGGELTNLAQLGGVAVSMGAGARDAGTQRITVATDDILLSSYGADLTTIAGAVAGTEMQVDVLTMPSVVLTATATDGTTKFVGGVTKVIGIGAVVTPTPTVPVTDDIGMPGMSVDRRLWVDADITASVALDVSAATVPISAASLPLPADAATQTTLAAINAKLVTGTDIGDVTINNASGASAVNIQDGGNSITVDGTITANLSATDNAVLDSAVALLTTIDADTSTLAAIDFATGADVSSLGVVGGGTEAAALRVTIANDSTGLVSIDDGGGSITVDETFFQATQPVSIAATVTVDGSGVTQPVSGTFWQATQPVSGTVTANPASGTIDTVTTVGAVTSITNAVTVDHSTGSIGDGIKNVTLAGTAEALAGSTACKWVMITARSGNAGTVYVGGSTVVANVTTGRGTPLAANQTASMLIDNLADVWLDVTDSGDGVQFSYGAA